MKKFLVGVVAAMMAVLLCFSLAGCDKSGNVQKAFEDKGYTVTKVDSSNAGAKVLLSGLSDEQKEKADKYGIYFCVDGIKTAVFIKCPSAGDLKDFLTVEKDGEKDTSAYDKAKENGLINGNCYLITLTPACIEIFKNA